MYKYYLLIIIFINTPYLSFAQNIPAASKGTIQFYVDYSCFKGVENKSVVEIYLMLYADQLKYTQIRNNSKAVYKVSAIVKDSTGGKTKEQTWTTEVEQSSDSTELKNYVVYDQWRTDLIPGEYVITLNVEDINGEASGIVETKLNIPNLKSYDLLLSQIEFVNSVQTDQEKSVFNKGSNRIIPNPSRRYGVLNPTLYFYYEIYNISQIHNGNILINYSIVDKNDKLVKKYPEITKEKNSANTALIYGVDVTKIPTGIYEIKINVKDTVSNKEAETEKYFEVVQLDYVSKNPVLSEEQAEIAADQIKYFATPRELNLYNRLDLTGKAQFLIRFWNEKDPTPGTKKNEFLDEVKQRFQYANENYGTGKIHGWKTDRGRVLIKYGKPDEIENHHFETGTVPYEIWTYNEQKKFQFVFADLQNNGNFVLIHSSKEGEVANYNWQEYIKRM